MKTSKNLEEVRKTVSKFAKCRQLRYLRFTVILAVFRPSDPYFLKPFLKGKILRSSERGVNSILTTILRF